MNLFPKWYWNERLWLGGSWLLILRQSLFQIHTQYRFFDKFQLYLNGDYSSNFIVDIKLELLEILGNVYTHR